MNKIESMLQGENDTYKLFINRLQTVLMPYAQLVIGQKPTYMGFPPTSLNVGTCENENHCAFEINGTVLAVVCLDEPKASVFGCPFRELEPSDYAIVIKLITMLDNGLGINCEKEIQDMMDELLAMLSKFRN